MKYIFFLVLVFTSQILVFSSTLAETRYATELTPLKSYYILKNNIPNPENNKLTKARVRLGKMLYFEPRISKNGNMSCATCHNLGLGWEDGMQTGIRHNQKRQSRHTPTILNLAWAPLLFWDGRAATLEILVQSHLISEDGLGITPDQLANRLKTISGYKTYFDAAYPNEEISVDTVSKSIASYQRTVVSGRASFDKWVKGQENAISKKAKRGFILFNGKARCSVCHQGWRFTNDSFHDIGLNTTDNGRQNMVKDDILMKHAFKTPTLRNISQRAPYMHDGSLKTLDKVLDHYESGFIRRPSLSPEIKSLSLTDKERSDLKAFLQTLTSRKRVTIPFLPQ